MNETLPPAGTQLLLFAFAQTAAAAALMVHPLREPDSKRPTILECIMTRLLSSYDHSSTLADPNRSILRRLAGETHNKHSNHSFGSIDFGLCECDGAASLDWKCQHSVRHYREASALADNLRGPIRTGPPQSVTRTQAALRQRPDSSQLDNS